MSIDTISIDEGINGASNMLALLDEELTRWGGWKVVISHYPCHSAGGYPGVASIRESVLPILKKHSVDFYITGHDHNQQHWVEKENTDGVEHVITGAGGQNRYNFNEDYVTINEQLGMEMKFFDDIYGFSYFVVGSEGIKMQFVNLYGEVIYESFRNK